MMKQAKLRQAVAVTVEQLESRTFMTVAPTPVIVTGVSTSQIRLDWTDRTTNETHFIIDRSVNGGAYARIGSMTANGTTFNVGGLSAGTKYDFRIKAITPTGNSAWAWGSGATVAPAPTNVRAAGLSPSQVQLTWTDATPNETHYIIDRSSNGGATYSRVASVGANATSWTDAGRAPETVYHYRIKAITLISNSAWVRASGGTMALAPSGFTGQGLSTSQIQLSWTDNSAGETHFLLDRSDDGGNTFVRIASIPTNTTTYTSGGLSANTTYAYRIKAVTAASNSTWAYTTAATQEPVEQPEPPPVTPGALASPSQAAVNAAIATPLIRFNRSLNSAYTNGAWFGGASVTLAVAAFTGNTSADARLLQQMRYSITGGNDITANGGYHAQHERHVTGMYALAKLTPRIWNQLTTAERAKIDLVMKAALVASAFTTSDNSPYIAGDQDQRALDGDTNLNRDWNPNYREGMIGGMLVGAAYFGPTQAIGILESYNHTAFVAELTAAGLTNIRQTFNWKVANPTSIAPSGATIEQGIRVYRYYGLPLTDMMGIYGKLLERTYGKVVEAGLNDGAGVDGGGKIVSGAETLPNKGALGMLWEFDGVDAGGPRSSASYAYDGFRPHQTNLLVLIASGHWDRDSAIAQTAATRLQIGNTDLWYKLDRGYIGYAKGAVRDTFGTATQDWGFTYNRSLWEDVVRPYLTA